MSAIAGIRMKNPEHTGMSSFREERTLFAHFGSHKIFQPVESYPPMRFADLAAADIAASGGAG